jgi:hypothetical protein
LARRNYNYEKRRRELAKKKKKEEKTQRKLAKRDGQPSAPAEQSPDSAALD